MAVASQRRKWLPDASPTTQNTKNSILLQQLSPSETTRQMTFARRSFLCLTNPRLQAFSQRDHLSIGETAITEPVFRVTDLHSHENPSPNSFQTSKSTQITLYHQYSNNIHQLYIPKQHHNIKFHGFSSIHPKSQFQQIR